MMDEKASKVNGQNGASTSNDDHRGGSLMPPMLNAPPPIQQVKQERKVKAKQRQSTRRKSTTQPRSRRNGLERATSRQRPLHSHSRPPNKHNSTKHVPHLPLVSPVSHGHTNHEQSYCSAASELDLYASSTQQRSLRPHTAPHDPDMKYTDSTQNGSRPHTASNQANSNKNDSSKQKSSNSTRNNFATRSAHIHNLRTLQTNHQDRKGKSKDSKKGDTGRLSRSTQSQGHRTPHRANSQRSGSSTPDRRFESSRLNQTRISRTASAQSMRRTMTLTGSVAGYVPPTDFSRLNEDLLDQAKQLIHDTDQLNTCLADPLWNAAAQQIGIDMTLLVPRELSSFRNTPATPRSHVQIRYEAYEDDRVRTLALLLSQLDHAAEEKQRFDAARAQLQDELRASLENNIRREEAALERAAALRDRVRAVVRQENAQLRAARQEFEKKQKAEEQMKQWEAQMEEARNRMKQKKERQKQKKREKVKQRAQEIEEARIQAALDAIEAQKEREREQARQREQERQEKQRRALETALQRERQRQQHTDYLKQQREEMEELYAERDEKFQQMKAQQEEERSQHRAMEYVKSKRRIENARRMQREREYQQRVTMEKKQMVEERMDVINQMKRAFLKEKQHIDQDELRHEHTWRTEVVIEKHVTPGPGEYSLKTFVEETAGGRWGRAQVPRLQDQVAAQAKKSPGPGQYEPDKYVPSGGYISNHKTRGYTDWAEFYGAQSPGPGEYRPQLTSGKGNAGDGSCSLRFSSSNSTLDAIAKRASTTPGPGDHSGPTWTTNRVTSTRGAPSVASLRRSLSRGQIPTIQPDGFGGTIRTTSTGSQPNLSPVKTKSQTSPLSAVLQRSRRSFSRISTNSPDSLTRSQGKNSPERQFNSQISNHSPLRLSQPSSNVSYPIRQNDSTTEKEETNYTVDSYKNDTKQTNSTLSASASETELVVNRNSMSHSNSTYQTSHEYTQSYTNNDDHNQFLQDTIESRDFDNNDDNNQNFQDTTETRNNKSYEDNDQFLQDTTNTRNNNTDDDNNQTFHTQMDHKSQAPSTVTPSTTNITQRNDSSYPDQESIVSKETQPTVEEKNRTDDMTQQDVSHNQNTRQSFNSKDPNSYSNPYTSNQQAIHSLNERNDTHMETLESHIQSNNPQNKNCTKQDRLTDQDSHHSSELSLLDDEEEEEDAEDTYNFHRSNEIE